jgi:hypothetical protein
MGFDPLAAVETIASGPPRADDPLPLESTIATVLTREWIETADPIVTFLTLVRVAETAGTGQAAQSREAATLRFAGDLTGFEGE